jgi:RNA polymerase sigma factor (sigma-70 family)
MPETDKVLEDSQHALIRACVSGDRASQGKLYELYAARMLGVCMWYAKNRQEAEEILQDGFMRVFTYLHRYTGEGSFEGWIRKIMVNAALFKYRNKSSLRIIDAFSAADSEKADENSTLARIHEKELVKLIQTLTPGYRMVFNLYVFEGMKHREIAVLLGISEGTSKSNLANARAILQKALTVKKKAVSS